MVCLARVVEYPGERTERLTERGGEPARRLVLGGVAAAAVRRRLSLRIGSPQRCCIAPNKEMQLLIALAASAAALKPVDRLDAAAVTLDRPVAPLPTFAPLPVVADAPDKTLEDVPDLPLRRAALREWSAENNRVEGFNGTGHFIKHTMRR